MSYEVDYISWLERQKERLTFKYNKMKEENEQLKEENEKLEQIRDFKDSALKGADIKIKTLERENEKLKEELLQSDYVKASVLSDREEYKNRIIELTKENKALRLQSDTYFEQWQNEKLKGEN